AGTGASAKPHQHSSPAGQRDQGPGERAGRRSEASCQRRDVQLDYTDRGCAGAAVGRAQHHALSRRAD
nr:hypothetical protein [Tanacetum cinerariifolium]